MGRFFELFMSFFPCSTNRARHPAAMRFETRSRSRRRAFIDVIVVVAFASSSLFANATRDDARVSCANASANANALARCRFAVTCALMCAPHATCVKTFSFAKGRASTERGMREYTASSDANELGAVVLGGDARCTALGCDAYAIRGTFQNAALTETFETPWCEIRDVGRRCEGVVKGIARDVTWSEIAIGARCENTFLPCLATVVAEIDFLAVVSGDDVGAPPPGPGPGPTPTPTPDAPTPTSSASSDVRRRRAVAKAVAIVLASAILCYAFVGFSYAYALRAGWVEGFAEPCWSRRGAACEQVWCWCVPRYWRASDEECLEAYEEARRRARSRVREPILGSDSETEE